MSIIGKSPTIKEGIKLCEILYEKLGHHGFFPALTGGVLYKEGARKDIDIVLFRHRQNIEEFETTILKDKLSECGIEIIGYYGFVTKAKWNDFEVDIFNPETRCTDDDYEEKL